MTKVYIASYCARRLTECYADWISIWISLPGPLTHSVAQPLAQQQAAKNEEEELKERRDTPEEPETYKSERVRALSTDKVPVVVS